LLHLLQGSSRHTTVLKSGSNNSVAGRQQHICVSCLFNSKGPGCLSTLQPDCSCNCWGHVRQTWKLIIIYLEVGVVKLEPLNRPTLAPWLARAILGVLGLSLA
jgi:hypothetical protein